MNRREDRSSIKSKSYLLLTTLLVFIVTVVICLGMYQYDNKYTADGPKASNGVLRLDQASLNEYPVLFLINGWEYYGNRLLIPEDFTDNPPDPDQYMFIGRFGGFEKWSEDSSPHGSASYRLNIQIPERPSSYMLELPEIFSSYRLYINGTQVVQMGIPDKSDYQPETGNRSVVVTAGGNIEILVAVSDFSHLYSGMVYPPAFGQPTAVSALLNGRLIFRSLLCAVALTIGLLSVWVGLLAKRNKRALLFGLLCLLFVGYVSYPLTKTLLAGYQPQYVLENLCFNAMLCIVMLLTKQVCDLKNRWSWIFISYGAFMCGLTLVLHSLLSRGNLSVMIAYSKLIGTYELLTAIFITTAVLLAIWRGVRTVTPLLYGIVIFDCTLIFDRLLPTHEPILTGWFIELASFSIILLIGVLIGHEVATQYRERAVLLERASSMERLYQGQLSLFGTLKQEMEQTKTMRHDMRHHLTVIDSYVEHQEYDKLSKYVKEYHSASADGKIPEYCPIDVINILTHHYHMVAQENQIHLDIRCDMKAASNPEHTNMTDSDLCCLYSNLVENAVEACLRMPVGQRSIRIAVFRINADTLMIHIWNSAEHVKQVGGRFLSSKQSGRTGYGLASIEGIATKYGGSVDFYWDSNKKEFVSKVTLMV